MGVISIANEHDVWGASRTFIYSIIEFAIARADARAYLLDFKNQFDWGYNAIGLEGLSDEDFLEFASLLQKYVGEKGYSELSYRASEAEASLDDLLKRVEAAKLLRGL